MKKSIYIVLLAFAALFSFASCEREFSMKEVGTESVAPVLAAVSDQVIDANNSKAESVIFNWTPASFGAPVQIQYTLYLTREGAEDVLAGQTFSTAVAVEKATINSGAVALGIEKNGTGTIGAKVVASVYTGPSGSTSFAMSNSSNDYYGKDRIWLISVDGEKYKPISLKDERAVQPMTAGGKVVYSLLYSG